MITTLYAIFKSGKHIGKLIHLAYVEATNPHEALDKYLHEDKSQQPTGLIAIPISSNKFTYYRKRNKKNPTQLWKNKKIKSLYDQIKWFELKIPLDHVDWYTQRWRRYHTSDTPGPTIKLFK